MKKTKKLKRLLSIFLSVLIIISSAACCFTAFAAGSTPIDETNFPDTVFRNIVAANFDLDENGYLDESEAKAVKRMMLDIYNENDEVIENVKGIEYFTNLESFQIHGSGLTELDVSKNTNLQKLTCMGNELTELDVSKNTQLTELVCAANKLTELNVSNNTELTKLHCYTNKIKSLNLSNNKKLVYLSVYSNELTELNLSQNTALQSVMCSRNHLTSLNLTALSMQTITNAEIGEQTISINASKTSNGFLVPISFDFNRVFGLNNGYATAGGIEFADYQNFAQPFTYLYDTGLQNSEKMDITVTANKDFYRVQFLDYYGRVAQESIVVNGGTAVPPLLDFAVDGEYFNAWDTDFSNVTTDLVVRPIYSKILYTVEFVDFDGTVLSTQTVNRGESAAAPAVPARDGYTFVSWNADFTNVTENLTVKPIYIAINYNITYNNDNGAEYIGEKTESFTVEDSFDLPALSSDNQEFLGWFTDQAFTQPITTIPVGTMGDIDVYAKWGEKVPTGYTVSGYISGMTSLDDIITGKQTVIDGLTVTLYAQDGETVIDSAETIGNCYFEFNDVINGSYILKITGEAALTRTINVVVNSADVTVSTADRMIGIVNVDFSKNGTINVEDYTAFLNFMGTNLSSENWNANADINGDKIVNVEDYTIFLKFMGKRADNAYTAWEI